MAVTISARVPEGIAEELRNLARDEDRSVSEIINRALDEYVRCARFPGIVFVTGASGRRQAMVRGGQSVWGIVLNARGFDMDPEKTADYLRMPVTEVRLALAYYRAYPLEIDARFRRMEEFEKDPQRRCPGIHLMNVTEAENEAPA